MHSFIDVSMSELSQSVCSSAGHFVPVCLQMKHTSSRNQKNFLLNKVLFKNSFARLYFSFGTISNYYQKNFFHLWGCSLLFVLQLLKLNV